MFHQPAGAYHIGKPPAVQKVEAQAIFLRR